MIIKTCEFCGKEFKSYPSQNKRFCGHDCWYKAYHDMNKDNNLKTCEWCGKEYRTKNKNQKFCSTNCADKYKETQVGGLSPHFKQVIKICECCGNKFSIKPSKINTRRFCCYKCFNEWQKKDEAYKEKMAENMQKEKQSGVLTNPNTMTKPHRIIVNVLDSLGIKYQCEYPIKYYLVDIYLVESKLMIEVMGDYWHSNPNIIHDMSGVEQRRRITRDKAKHTYIKNEYKIEVLYLWETDILERLDVCTELIKKYINSKGRLWDYQSYNYQLNDDKLSLNEEMVSPPYEML